MTLEIQFKHEEYQQWIFKRWCIYFVMYLFLVARGVCCCVWAYHCSFSSCWGVWLLLGSTALAEEHGSCWGPRLLLGTTGSGEHGSCWGAQILFGSQALGRTDFHSFSSWALEHRLGVSGSLTQLPPGTWDLPRSRMESMSPALQGRFLSPEPPGETPHGGL